MGQRSPRARRHELHQGLVAVTKSLLLVLAVPLCITRLWFARALPAQLWSAASLREVTLWLHVVLVALGALWALAAARLVRDLVEAFGNTAPTEANRWSSRWAGAIAALLLVSSASAVAAASVPRSRSLPATSSSATGLRPSNAPPSRVSGVATVGAGECLADVARRALGAAELWPTLARANLGRLQVDGTRLVDPSLLRAGWCLEVPGGAVARGELRGAAPSSAAASGGDLAGQVELALLGLDIVSSAALVRRLRLLRRAAESLRAPGERGGPPGVAEGAAEAMLRPYGEGSLLDWIECANRLLSAVLLGASQQELPGEIVLVRAGPEAVEFLFTSAPGTAPAPFRSLSGGRWWILPLDLDLESCRARALGARRFSPALVPIGDGGGAVYLLGLGPRRRLVLEGAAAEVERTLAGLVASLRVLPWAEELEVSLLGLEAPPAGEQCYQLTAGTTAALEVLARGSPTPRRASAARWRREPLVVANELAGVAAEATLREVNEVAGIISCAGVGSERLVLDGSRGTLEPYGIELAVASPDATQQQLFEKLLAGASRSPALVTPPPRALPATVPRGLVEVHLLSGEPDLVGAPHAVAPRDAARVTELLAYLSLHGSRAENREIASALFHRAALLGSPSRLDTLLAAARQLLGTDSGGRPLLRQEQEAEVVTLAPEVTSDWMRLRSALAGARAAGPQEAMAALQAALELLDAPRLASWAPYDWLIGEGLLATLTSEVLDGAHHLATLSLALDDFTLARRAIAIGRALEPASEMLVRDEIALLQRSGDLDGAAFLYADLEEALAELGGNEPSPETRALLRAPGAREHERS